jgi:uncharacterized protein YigE (DUF2233 family)
MRTTLFVVRPVGPCMQIIERLSKQLDRKGLDMEMRGGLYKGSPRDVKTHFSDGCEKL